ncbi:MAG TPA: hypothetical protein VK184_00245 [Nostocaceae cyanobacterium]|nr:hypothetical protein [Nostocaceae cyanobacterium]
MSEHRLNEIVIERPRCGRRISAKRVTGFKKSLYKLTVEATEDGLFRPYVIKVRKKTKYLTDHLGPLRRFLLSKAGQPWDEVYSELCQRLDTSTMTGLHVLSHLKHFVEEHVEIIDGVSYEKPYQGRHIPLTDFRDKLYVHPETGILTLANKNPRKQKRESYQDDDAITIDDYHQYQKLNEIWYLITFEDFPPFPHEFASDIIKGLIHYSRATTIRGRGVYAVKKKQCNKKELRLINSKLVLPRK